MDNYTESHKQTAVGTALKKHYKTFLLEYELAHDDVQAERCSVTVALLETGLAAVYAVHGSIIIAMDADVFVLLRITRKLMGWNTYANLVGKLNRSGETSNRFPQVNHVL